jgi:hypothetical protein
MNFLGMIGSFVQAGGSILEGRANKDQLNYQGKLDQIEGKQAMDDARVHASLIREMGRKARGEATAAYAASGVDVNSETAMQVDQEIAALSERDAEYALLTGERAEAAGNRSRDFRKYQGQQAKGSGIIGAVGSLLGGMGKMF